MVLEDIAPRGDPMFPAPELKGAGVPASPDSLVGFTPKTLAPDTTWKVDSKAAWERQLTRNGQSQSLDVKPGKSHWIGYTTIIKGVIFSDELLVTGDSVLRTKNDHQIQAKERWMMLLNAAPYPTLS